MKYLDDTDPDLASQELSYSKEAARLYRSTPAPDIPFDGLLTETEMARRLDISNEALHQRLTHGLLLGWRQQSGQFVFPAGQLDALNRPAQGMKGVLSNLSDPQVAWLWLQQPTALLRGQTPIELLKPDDTGQTSTEQIERVVEAASAKALGAFE